MQAWWVKKLIPEPFLEFLPYATPNALHIIHFNQVLALVTRVALQARSEIKHHEGTRALKESLFFRRSTSEILIASPLIASADLNSLHFEDRKIAGQRVLEIYFACLREGSVLPLDLRPKHFRWDPLERRLEWSPSSIQARLSPEFHRSLLALYEGFFEEKPAATERGLRLYAWETPVSDAYFTEVDAILRTHFGDARSGHVTFAMSHFKSTFKKLFDQAIAAQAKLHPELALVGVALAGLYVTLETLAVPLDVARAYRAVFSPEESRNDEV